MSQFPIMAGFFQASTPPASVAAPGAAVQPNGTGTSVNHEFTAALLGALIGRTDTPAVVKDPGLLTFPMTAVHLGEEQPEANPPVGSMLENWLAGLAGEAELNDQDELIAELTAFLPLIQAMLETHMPAAGGQFGQNEQNDPGATGSQPAAAQLIRALQEALVQLKQQPGQSEWTGLVKALELAIARHGQQEQERSWGVSSDLKPSSHQSASAADHPLSTSWPPTVKQESAGKQEPTQAALRGGDEVGEAIISASDMKLPGASNSLDLLARAAASMQQPSSPDTPVVSAERLVSDFTPIFKNMKVSRENGLTEVRIRLMPEHLGQVDVKVSMHNGQIVALLAADTVQGKELLESQLAHLRTMLQVQGLQVDRIEVTQSSSLLSSGMFQDSRQQQSAYQPERKGKSKPSGYEQEQVEFVTELEPEPHTAAIRGAGYNSIDVSA